MDELGAFPDVINSKGLVVSKAMVSEERLGACMKSRGYTWTGS
jgi:hypothetical protein